MLPLTLKLKKKEIFAIKEYVKYEEARVIRRACLTSIDIASLNLNLAY
jgi:hypothetical protein